jgi:tight adherence protein C
LTVSTIQLLVAAIAAGSVFLIALGVSGAMQRDRVHLRLQGLGTKEARNLEALELQQPFLERTIRPLVDRLSAVATRTSSATFATRTSQRLALAGHPGDLSVGDWLSLKLLTAVLGGAIIGLVFAIVGAAPFMALLVGAGGLGVGYIAPEFWLSGRVRSRQAAIVRATPDALDLLAISVRAGLGFDAGLQKVVEQVKGPLADEFQQSLASMRLGKSRREALREIVPRTNVRALTNFIGAIIQAEQLGVPIGKVLQVQSEQLRVERRQRAETMAAKAPIKMLFPLVGCVFPSLFVVILGPAIIILLNGFNGS